VTVAAVHHLRQGRPHHPCWALQPIRWTRPSRPRRPAVDAAALCGDLPGRSPWAVAACKSCRAGIGEAGRRRLGQLGQARGMRSPVTASLTPAAPAASTRSASLKRAT